MSHPALTSIQCNPYIEDCGIYESWSDTMNPVWAFIYYGIVMGANFVTVAFVSWLTYDNQWVFSRQVRGKKLADYGWSYMTAWNAIVLPIELVLYGLAFIYNPTIRLMFIYWTNVTMWGIYGVYGIIWGMIALSLFIDRATTTSRDKWLLLAYTLVIVPTAYF